ncbi:putative nucleotide-binding alpha-beta plait domain superfamily, RNA-binding domain superfamily [Helianthus annuus]|uniref:RNA recognition motif domain, nucleotide-binding alpha-beta plait domain superfamily n=1 Tax=Helianthus annuus TaxID=4232 RepID=A0A9K3IK17_HELAN|nr:putative RNA recognition motif domain, nucleotide-binding alpha-beta plait domain superfamily [Helianthus annuus]KAJ0550002.1 putative nucleotide-binding alpha-beta plait domain superfamily, RNA-binding domain superfamily [Helianthus annuus]KAJ0556591.1 putative nucleotide-binding alpha-beta plait domain superfamily, RNA-binding domain superfamily [Helianthus annuus]KAJ0562961.1 putative nucleotide-binding alpha-beta plait domain superfamily, RNA-binding domain superfamily [Helianthus annuus]
MRSSSKKITRIFVARIPLSVTEAVFRSHWRDIGFVHAQDSVDNLMFETHELGGSDVVVDRATPKEDNFRPVSRILPPPPLSGGYGGESARGTGKKIFIGRIPKEASVEDLRLYFGRFGRILDVYIPKVI